MPRHARGLLMGGVLLVLVTASTRVGGQAGTVAAVLVGAAGLLGIAWAARPVLRRLTRFTNR